MKKILIATTNINKVDRIKNLFRFNKDLEFTHLGELKYTILEPLEDNTDAVSIAKDKANYYFNHLQIKFPTIAQDDTIFLKDVEEWDQIGNNIKDPVIKSYGAFTDKNALTYYTQLAGSYGGAIEMEFRYGHALANSNLLVGVGSTIKCYLVDSISNKIEPGYFLNSIVKVKLDNIEKYYSELTSEERRIIDQPIFKSIQSLIKNI